MLRKKPLMLQMERVMSKVLDEREVAMAASSAVETGDARQSKDAKDDGAGSNKPGTNEYYELSRNKIRP